MDIPSFNLFIPNMVNNIPDFNNNVVTNQTLKDDVNPTVSYADNNTRDDKGIDVYA